jgi:hypothetical protein
MPKVLTQKEFETLSLVSHKQEEPEIVKTESAPPEPSIKEEVKKPEKMFFFVHPDRSETYSLTGIFQVEVRGIVHKLGMTNGILTTTDEEIKTALISKGLIFTHEKTIEETQ